MEANQNTAFIATNALHVSYVRSTLYNLLTQIHNRINCFIGYFYNPLKPYVKLVKCIKC